MFTKEDYNKWLEDKSNIELNKKMVEEFPFLLPHNRWTDKVSEDYDYSYNELYALEDGWAKAFGYEMICEIRDTLKEANYLDKYRITQIKEKYGTLRWYDFGAPETTFNVILKYCKLSGEICVRCGKPATHETYGWINYVCEKCLNEHQLSGRPIGEDEEDYFEEGEE